MEDHWWAAALNTKGRKGRGWPRPQLRGPTIGRAPTRPSRKAAGRSSHSSSPGPTPNSPCLLHPPPAPTRPCCDLCSPGLRARQLPSLRPQTGWVSDRMCTEKRQALPFSQLRASAGAHCSCKARSPNGQPSVDLSELAEQTDLRESSLEFRVLASSPSLHPLHPGQPPLFLMPPESHVPQDLCYVSPPTALYLHAQPAPFQTSCSLRRPQRLLPWT